MKKLSLGLLASLSLWLGACFESPTASNSKGTDTPNALTITVDDSNSHIIPNAKVYALIKTPNKMDTLVTGYTDNNGRVVFSYPKGAKIWLSSSIESQGTLIFDIDSLTDSSQQLSLKLTHLIKINSQDSELPIFADLSYRPSRDLNLDAWSESEILALLEQAKAANLQGVYLSLFGVSSPISSSGPALDTRAQNRLKWIIMMASIQGLELHINVFDQSARNNSALKPYFVSKTWIYSNYFTNLAIPISTLLCNELGCNQYSIQITAFNSSISNLSDADFTEMINEWQVTNPKIKGGIDLNTLTSPINNASLRSAHSSSDFIIMSSESYLSPLDYPAEILGGGIPMVVRWESNAKPSGQIKKALKEHHYQSLIISDTLLF